MKKTRIHFVDERQDLTYLDVEHAHGMGAIRRVSRACSPLKASKYVGMAVMMAMVVVGSPFEFANPKDGFKVTVSRWIVERIESLD